jgi:hypothetical protein
MDMRKVSFLFVVIAYFLGSQVASADFTLNFQPRDPNLGDNFYPDARCNFPEFGSDLNCGHFGTSDSTPFLQELYTDPDTNMVMYHLIIGSPSSGFSQEVFIRANGRTWEGGAGSAALGDGLCRSGFNWTSECNAFDPLGGSHDNVFTGDATGDPTAVIMRQIQGGTWDSGTSTWSCGAGQDHCQQFLKASMSQKPIIDQTVRDISMGMTATFSFDMSNSDYQTDNIAGTLQSTVEFSANGAGDFNYAQNVKPAGSNITGGRFKFTGSGPTDANLNPYVYFDGNFILDQDWAKYKN